MRAFQPEEKKQEPVESTIRQALNVQSQTLDSACVQTKALLAEP